MVRQTSLAFLLLVASASAFVTPFGGIHKISCVAPRQVLASEPTEAAEASVPPTSEIVAEDATKPKSLRDRENRHTMFVGNLPFTATMEEIKEKFAAYGEVMYVSLPKIKESGQARGFAFVDMAEKEQCDKAIAGLHDTAMGGRTIRVTHSVPNEEGKPAPKKKIDDGTQKLYVGNISFETNQEDLNEFFSEFGEVTDIYIPSNKDGTPRGFAFVSMKEEDANAVIEKTNGAEFMGRSLTVNLPLPVGQKAARPARTPSNRTKLYIGNLSFYTSIDTITEMFEEFGEVHDCYMPEDPVTGSARGFGFITMDNEAAARAIQEIDGCEVDGRIIRVNEAKPKGQMQQEEAMEE